MLPISRIDGGVVSPAKRATSSSTTTPTAGTPAAQRASTHAQPATTTAHAGATQLSADRAERRITATGPRPAATSMPSPMLARADAADDAYQRGLKHQHESSAKYLDTELTAADRAKIAADQKSIDRTQLMTRVSLERNPEASSTFIKHADASMVEYFKTHSVYVDKDGTAYKASYVKGELHLLRVNDAPAVPELGADARTDTHIKVSLTGARETTHKTFTPAATPTQPQHVVMDTTHTAPSGTITHRTTSETVNEVGHDGATSTSNVTRNFAGADRLTSVTSSTSTTRGATTESSTRHIELDHAGTPRSATSTFEHTEPGTTHTETSRETMRADGSTLRREDTVTTHTDAVPAFPGHSATPAVDSHATSITHFDRESLPTSSHSESTTTSGASTRTETTDTTFHNGIPSHVKTDATTTDSKNDSAGNLVRSTDHTITNVSMNADGKPVKIHTDSTSKTHSTDDTHASVDSETHSVTDIAAGGKALTFDATTGAPKNATITGTLDVTTTIAAGDDATKRQILEQHGTTNGDKTTWNKLRVTVEDRNTDGTIYTRNATDYTAHQLDANGMPQTNADGEQVDGTSVDDLHVDNRSWWNRNKHMVGTVMSISGGILAVTGVGSAIGGALMVAGGAIALSDDIPALIHHPSWQGALAVGLDTVGMVAGGASALGTIAETSALAAKGLQTTTAVLNNPLVKVGGAYALGNQAYQTGSKIWKDGIDSLSAEEIIGALGTVVTVGAAHYVGRGGTAHISEPSTETVGGGGTAHIGEPAPKASGGGRTGSGSVTSTSPRPEYVVPKDVITDLQISDKKIQHEFKHAEAFGVEVRRSADGSVLSPNAQERAAFRDAIDSHIANPDTVAIQGTFKPKSGSTIPQQAVLYIEPASGKMVAVDAGGSLLAAYELNPGQLEHAFGHGSVGYTPIKTIEASRAQRAADASADIGGVEPAPMSRAGDALRTIRDHSARGWDQLSTKPGVYQAAEGVRNLLSWAHRDHFIEPKLDTPHASAGDVTYTNPRRALGSRSASIADINQGQLGDCYLNAAMGAYVAADADAIGAMVRRKGGAIEVKLGNGATVRMSRALPARDGNLIYAGINPDAPLWSAYVEKAYAISHGGYDVIGQGGWPSHAMAFMKGTRASTTALHRASAETYGDMLQAAGPKAMSTVAIRPTSGMGSAPDATMMIYEHDLYGNHAYSVSDIYTTPAGETMVQLTNPWGMRHPKPVPLDVLNRVSSGITIDDHLVRKLYS